MKDFKRVTVLPALVLLPLVTSQGIHPYLDGGTMSLVISTVVGVLMTAVIAIRMFWNQIKAFFGKLFHAKGRKEDEEGR